MDAKTWVGWFGLHADSPVAIGPPSGACDGPVILRSERTRSGHRGRTRDSCRLRVVKQELAQVRVVVRSDPGQKETDLVAQDVSDIVTEAELLGIEMRDEN